MSSQRWCPFVLTGLALVAIFMGCGDTPAQPIVHAAPPCNWTQWGHDASHSGTGCVPAQPLQRVLAHIVLDPFTDQEIADTDGDLLVRYQVPLLVDDDVYLEVKSGSYVPCPHDDQGEIIPDAGICGNDARDQIVRTEKRFRWEGQVLAEKWSFTTDWKPLPTALARWEPVFQPALSGDVIYVPGAGGTMVELDRITGTVRNRHDPFAPSNPNAFVAGGVTVDAQGNVFYNVIALDPASAVADAKGWLVKITRGGDVSKVSYDALAPEAPAGTADCVGVFTVDAGFVRPFPPPPDDAGAPVVGPSAPCLSQRPGINVTPAVGPDGTVFTVSTAHGNGRYGYLVAVNPDLTLKWAASLRDRLDDGCGVLIPSDGVESPPDAGETIVSRHCRMGTADGVDPLTNQKPVGVVHNNSSSSPVALPDGSVIYGAYSNYNTSRGHLFKFDADGQFLGTFDFGWDVTPAVFAHDGTYSIVDKDNRYYYWVSVPPVPLPDFRISWLNASLRRTASFKNTNTRSCKQEAGGSVTCVDDGEHLGGFEWCVNAPAVDSTGVVYANSEDGNVYGINPDGTEKARFFLTLALGAAYTPLSIDYAGRIFAMNHGELIVVGE
jgi:outer membrane protein assembly factor BamB